MRVIGCGRASKVDQELTIPAQHRRIVAECEARGWELLEFTEDQQGRGKTGPGLAWAIGELVAHRADVLMVAKLDRLPRSVASVAGLMEQAQREGWMLVVLDPQINMTTAYGRAMGQMAAVFAELERALTSQRTVEALAELKARGEPWVSKSGRLCTRLGGPSTLTEETRARVIALAAEKGLRGTARILNDEGVATGRGGRQWWASSVRSVVKAG